MKQQEHEETISTIQTEAEPEDIKPKNYLEEYELINDSFPDENPE